MLLSALSSSLIAPHLPQQRLVRGNAMRTGVVNYGRGGLRQKDRAGYERKKTEVRRAGARYIHSTSQHCVSYTPFTAV